MMKVQQVWSPRMMWAKCPQQTCMSDQPATNLGCSEPSRTNKVKKANSDPRGVFLSVAVPVKPHQVAHGQHV